MGYVIVTGYWAEEHDVGRQEFFNTWWDNTHKHASPEQVFVVSCNGYYPGEKKGNWIEATANLGHVHHLIHGQRSQKLCGWTVSTLIGALLAYNCDADLIYKEQDCLCFGNWVEELYRAANETTSGMLFGQNAYMMVEQSLVFVKHSALLDYVKAILEMPETDAEVLPEAKYYRLHQSGLATHLPFPGGRDRPLDFETLPFYIQQTTAQEMEELRIKGLV